MEKLSVLNIQRFCTQDGPGIRTTVFLKGCGLRCAWCHNPETQQQAKELLYKADRCQHCLRCITLCPNQCHGQDDGLHQFDRSACDGCGLCLSASCPALELAGSEMPVSQVLEEVAKDLLFYQNSGGGLTLSGGEPLHQPIGSSALLKKAKSLGIHTCVETCGFASQSALKEILPWADLYLYDIKETDPQRHLEYTGVPLQPILDNLRYLDSCGKQTILRCPIVPEHNDRAEHFEQISKLANQFTHVQRIEIEPYHTFGVGKYEQLGRKGLPHSIPSLSHEKACQFAQLLRTHTHIPVLVAGTSK